MSDLLALPFDQYQRYRLVADLLDEVRPDGARWWILDVGGRTALLRAFLPADRVTLVDLEPSGEQGLVLGDGSRLPFADASFDVVAAFDTLEHVPRARRDAFVSECRRVARRYVVLAGPYDAPAVAAAETLLQQFLRDKIGVEHRYLEEHREHGLPDRAAVERGLAALGAEVESYGHGNLERWLGLIALSMYADYTPALRAVASRLHRFYNEHLFADDDAGPVYRHALVAGVDGAPLPRRARENGPEAPRGATAALRGFAFEMCAFDRERDVYETEWRRLETVVAGLEADLAGHKDRVRELERDLAGHRQHVRDVERDLAGHREQTVALERSLSEHREAGAALERDLAGHRESLGTLRARTAELEAELVRVRLLRERERSEQDAAQREHEGEIAAHADVRSTLEADLAGHRAALAELESICVREREEHERVVDALAADLAGHRAALAELRALEAAVRGENERVGAELARVRSELARVDSELTRTSGALAGRDRELELARADLASRWRSLRRALGRRQGLS